MFIFTKPLLRARIGNDEIVVDVFEAAVRYVRIRAVGMPAAALIGTAQAACLGLQDMRAACLGLQDMRSPLRIIGVAAMVNLVADLILVGSPRSWIGGAAGAS